MDTTLTLPLWSVKRDWIEATAPDVVHQMAGREFTTDDLHGRFFEPGESNWWGVLMAKLRNEGRVERVGFRRSDRPSANGRFVAVWRVRG